MSNDNFRTPPELFKRLSKIYGPFDIDVCADDGGSNALCPKWIGPSEDALKTPWFGCARGPRKAWCNPPYSRGNIGKFVSRAIGEVGRNRHTTAVLLLPSDTSTKWFRIAEECCEEYYFIPGRVRFMDENGRPSKHAARWPSVVFVFGGGQ